MIMAIVTNAINKFKQTDLQKIPRRWDTNMSPAMNASWLQEIKNWAELYHQSVFDRNSLSKWEAIQWLLSPVVATAKTIWDIASIPINAARNVYNTMADIANAKIAKHNEKAIQNREWRRNWVKKELSPTVAIRKAAEPVGYKWFSL